MKIFVALLVALALVALVMVALLTGGATPADDTDRQSETRSVSGFKRIRVEGFAQVTLAQGTAEGLTIDVAKGGLSDVHTEVEDETLVIRAGQVRHWWKSIGRGRRAVPHITVELRELERLEAAGAVTIAADRLRADRLGLDVAGACTVSIAGLDVNQLSVDGAGSTKATFSGRATEQKIDLSGAGSYAASELTSERASVQLSGAAKAFLNVAGTLDVDISGAGVVEYSGDPKLTQSISGAGRIRRAVPGDAPAKPSSRGVTRA